MSVRSRKEYLEKMHERYCKTESQSAKTAIEDRSSILSLSLPSS
ncbi:MAG: hypothetical protein AB1576_13715 [Bacillota bacterium]